MTNEVDWAVAVAASAPQMFALVADWDDDGEEMAGAAAPMLRTIAWGLQFPTHAVVWFVDRTTPGNRCAMFASADRALARLSAIFELRLVWPVPATGELAPAAR